MIKPQGHGRVLLNAAVYRGARLVEVLNVAELGTMDVLIRCDGFDCNSPEFTFQAKATDQVATVRRSRMAHYQKRDVAGRAAPDLP